MSSCASCASLGSAFFSVEALSFFFLGGRGVPWDRIVPPVVSIVARCRGGALASKRAIFFSSRLLYHARDHFFAVGTEAPVLNRLWGVLGSAVYLVALRVFGGGRMILRGLHSRFLGRAR